METTVLEQQFFLMLKIWKRKKKKKTQKETLILPASTKRFRQKNLPGTDSAGKSSLDNSKQLGTGAIQLTGSFPAPRSPLLIQIRLQWLPKLSLLTQVSQLVSPAQKNLGDGKESINILLAPHEQVTAAHLVKINSQVPRLLFQCPI